MKVKSESEVAQSCPTLRDPMDCNPPGSSVHGIFQARVLEWGAIAIDSDGKESGFDSWGQKIPWRREQLPTLVFWPGEFHGQRSLAGCTPRGCKELDTTEQLSTAQLQFSVIENLDTELI